MAIPLGLAGGAGAALLGATIGLGVDRGNLKSKIKHRDKDIKNLKAENQALRDQLEQTQNQQNQPTPWANFMQFPQLGAPTVGQQQPNVQMLNMLSMMMQMMQMGMGAAPAYNNMVGPQIGNYGNCNGGGQNFFNQLQNLMSLTNGLGNAVGMYQNLQRPGFGMPNPGMPNPGMPSPGMPGPFMPQTPGYNTMPTYGQPPVPTYGSPNTDRASITTLAKYATKLFPKGGNISMNDIRKIASGGRMPDGTEPPADLKMAARDLAGKPELFNKLQSTVRASKGKKDTDGLASVDDLTMFAQQLKSSTPNAPTTFNTNTPTSTYQPNAAYGSSFVNALMGHLQSSGFNPFLLNLLQQPQMQQPMLAH